MKKIIAILFISFLSLQTTFAWLSVIQETKIKTQVEKAYLSFEKELSKIETEAQIKKINTVIWKIDVLLKKKLSDKNKLILTHLNDLLKARKVFLESEQKSTLNSNINNTEIKNTTQTSTNAQVSENLVKDTSSPEVYTERWSVWWVDTKAQQTYDQAQVDAIKSSDLNMQLYNMSWPTSIAVLSERIWNMTKSYWVLSKWMQKWVNDEIITRAYIDWKEPNSARLRELEKIYWTLSWKTVYELQTILYNQYLWYFKDWKLLDEKEFEKANSNTKSSFSDAKTDDYLFSIYYWKLWYSISNWKVTFDSNKVSSEIQALKYIDLK